jgi:hypothetical protein
MNQFQRLKRGIMGTNSHGKSTGCGRRLEKGCKGRDKEKERGQPKKNEDTPASEATVEIHRDFPGAFSGGRSAPGLALHL